MKKTRRPGTGRPPRDNNNEAATYEVKVVLTKAEKVALKEKAILSGMSMAAVLRTAITNFKHQLS